MRCRELRERKWESNRRGGEELKRHSRVNWNRFGSADLQRNGGEQRGYFIHQPIDSMWVTPTLLTQHFP